MKKEVKKLLIFLAVIVALLAILAIDLFWVREKPNPNVDYTSSNVIKAYSVEDLGKSVVLTTYHEGTLMRTVRTIYFNNNKLTAMEEQNYYKTKIDALLDLKIMKLTNIQAIWGANMIYCRPQEEMYERGKTKEEFLKEIEEYYGKTSVRI